MLTRIVSPPAPAPGGAELEKLFLLIADVYRSSPYMCQPFEERYPDLQALGDEISRGLFVVAEREGHPVGYLSIEPRQAAKLRHTAELSMGIACGQQGKGLGTILLREALRALPSLGVEIVYLHVRADNAAALRLYENFGFEKLCTLERDTKIGAEYYDAILMRPDQ